MVIERGLGGASPARASLEPFDGSSSCLSRLSSCTVCSLTGEKSRGRHRSLDGDHFFMLITYHMPRCARSESFAGPIRKRKTVRESGTDADRPTLSRNGTVPRGRVVTVVTAVCNGRSFCSYTRLTSLPCPTSLGFRLRNESGGHQGRRDSGAYAPDFGAQSR